ncbi:uncharacterized protein LOC125286243 isoform X1 [Alosa alosa]|nr:uncharacterized protein LOC125286243 isoform X1 [Alosa alosa]
MTMAQSKSKSWCCVPLCTSNKQKQPYLSFHKIPLDVDRRRKWIQAIRRVEGSLFKVSNCSVVCSMHFLSSDLLKSASGFTRVKEDVVPSVFSWVSDTMSDTTQARKSVASDHDVRPYPGVASLDSSNPDFGSSVFPRLGQSLKMGRNQRKRRIDDMGTPPNQPVAWTTKQAGHLAKRAPEVKKEDVTEVIVGETGERTPTANAPESPETFSVEGRYAAGTWEQATVEAIMSLRLLGTTVTTTLVAQTIIANLKDENDFLRAHNANLRSELNAKQWTHEQEISDLQERLEILKQKCSCGAMSEKTVTSSEAALSDVMVAEIKTEHLSLC